MFSTAVTDSAGSRIDLPLELLLLVNTYQQEMVAIRGIMDHKLTVWFIPRFSAKGHIFFSDQQKRYKGVETWITLLLTYYG